jgi:hypothetical protein
MENNMTRLYCYKMTNDSGFAPNPFWGRLTLATCKPKIRQAKRVGDWIAGFTSRQLNGDSIGNERLIYLMKVSEKLTVAEYFLDKRFKTKIPSAECVGRSAVEASCARKRSVGIRVNNAVNCAGDNIYRPMRANSSEPGDFEQLPNPSHWDGVKRGETGAMQRRDISGGFVLVADEFVYFGKKAQDVSAAFRPEVPRGQSASGSITHDSRRAEHFIDYVLTNAAGARIISMPSKWPEGDESWREHL